MNSWETSKGRENIYNALKEHIEDIENVNIPEIIGGAKDPFA